MRANSTADSKVVNSRPQRFLKNNFYSLIGASIGGGYIKKESPSNGLFYLKASRLKTSFTLYVGEIRDTRPEPSFLFLSSGQLSP